MSYFKQGETVKLLVDFYDFGNQLIDPQVIKIIFYDREYKKINEFILGAGNRDSLGKYFYNYTIPNDHFTIYYEFNGEYNGLINLNRGKLQIKFI